MSTPLLQLSTETIWAVLLLFIRFTTMLMLLPAFGENYVTARLRVLLGLFLALLLTPVSLSLIPPLSHSPWGMGVIIAAEIFTGFSIGVVIKLWLTTMHIVGSIVSAQAGLSAAMLFDPSQGEQSTVVSGFLGSVTMVLIFALDLHGLFLKTLVESLHRFPIGQFWLVGDHAQHLTSTMSDVFRISLMLSSPQILLGLVLFGGAGVLARLMPSIQIFFIIVPLQISICMGLLMVTVTNIFLWYGEYITEAIEQLL